MDVRSLTSLQMTMLFVILSQIITLTHMLPVDSPYRRLDLDLLLDPVHQEMQSDDLESKRVVPKSVYHTQLRITTESPCNIGSQRTKEGGPCLRINSSQGSVLDEKYLADVLKGINRQGSNGRRKHNRNRNRSTTTTTEVPVVQSTLQQDQDGVEEDDTMLVDLMTSTYTPPSSLGEIQQTYELPGVLSTTFYPMQNSEVEDSDRFTGFRPGVGVMDSENEDALIPKTSTVRSTKPHEAVQMTSTIPTLPTDATTLPQEISTEQEVTATTLSTGTPEGQTEVPDVFQVIPEFMNANKKNFTNQSSPASSTTAKPDSFTLSSAVTDGLVTRITTGPKEKTVNFPKEMGENVTATDVRVINFPPTPNRTVSSSNSFPLNSTATTQSTTERLSVKKGQANEVDFEIPEFSTGLPQIENESFTATSIPEKRKNRPPLIMASIMESDLAKRTEPLSQSQVKSEILGEDTRTNVAAGAPMSPILADKNSTPRSFNYSESLMKETTTQLPISQSMGPDVQDFEILVESTTLPHPEDSSSAFPTSPLSSHESKIDQSIAITDFSPVITWVQEGRRVTAKLEDESSFTSPNSVFPPLNEELAPSTTTIRNEEVGIVGRIRFEDEETTTIETPREFTMTRKRVLIPFAPQPAPHHVEEGRSHQVQQQHQFQGRDSMRPMTSPVSPQFPTMTSQQSGEEDIDKLHHKSRTRNRMRNPDLEDVPQPRVQFPDEFFRHQQHQSSLSRDLQKQHQQVVSKPIVGSYPQFISLDYLRLGDNYRRFRVF